MTKHFRSVTIYKIVFIICLSFIAANGNGQSALKRDRAAFNQLVNTISSVSISKLDTLPILIKKANSIIAHYDTKDWHKEEVEIKYWQAFYYAYKKEFKYSISVLEEILPIALQHKHLYLGQICYQLAIQKNSIDNSLNGIKTFDQVFKNIDTSSKTAFTLNLFVALGAYYNNLNKSDKALQTLNHAATFTKQINADSIFREIYLDITHLYFNKGEFNKALKAGELSEYYALQLKDERNLNISKLNIAIINRNLGKFDEAIVTYFELLNIFEAKNDQLSIANTHLSIGIVYFEFGKFKKAIDHYLKTIEICKNKNDEPFISRKKATQYNLGICHYEMHNYKKSLATCHQILESSEVILDSQLLGRTYQLIASNYKDLKNHELAIYNFEKAIAIHRKTKNEHETYSAYKEYGQYLIEIGKIKEGGSYCKEAYQVLKNSGNIKVKSECIDCLTKYYEKTGNYKKANTFHKKYIMLRDSFVTGQNLEKITSEKIKYEHHKELVENKHRIAQLTLLSEARDTKIHNKSMVIYWSIAILLLGLIFCYYRVKQKRSFAMLEQARNEDLKKNHDKLNELHEALHLKKIELDNTNHILKEKKSQIEAELKDKLLVISSYSEVFSSLKAEITSNKVMTSGTKTILNKIIRQNSNKDLLDDLDLGLMDLNKEFVQQLTSKYNTLTNNNLKLCILIKMNIPNKKIAQMLHSSEESVKVAKNRLRKKLRIKNPKLTLASFLKSLKN